VNLYKNFIIGCSLHISFLLIMIKDTAYLFLAHGSRDLRTVDAMNQLASICSEKLPNTSTMVDTAYLELAELPIVDQIILFANQALQQGYQKIKILPLFLAPGIHVLEDLPAAVHDAQSQLSDRCQLELMTYLGASPGMIEILQYHSQELPFPQIFLAHGSKQATASHFLANMANTLQAMPAYWSVNPQLSVQVAQLAIHQPTEIGILPYFLFPGRISSAMTAAINELQSLFPDIQFRFGRGELETSLLCTDPRLIDLLVQMLLDSN
jgi:sirohydrochlorin cobaltochelatase